MSFYHGLLFALFVVLSSLSARAAQEFTYQETRVLTGDCQERIRCFDVTASLSRKSSWTVEEVIKRLEAANSVLQSCDLRIQRVHLMRWTPSKERLRVDETEAHSPNFDGMWEAARKGKLATPVRLFYFQDYLEPFTYGGSVPLAVYQDADFADHLHHTAWFPYQSAQRRRHGQSPLYSEEAHELGHLLLKAGHDHSGEPNIMANNSALRSPHFSPTQCENLQIAGPLSTDWFNHGHSSAWSIFSIFQSTYGIDFYMNDWCARNSQNFLGSIVKAGVASKHEVSLLIMRPRAPLPNFSPLRPRHSSPIPWRYHAVALVGDHVYDLDLKDQVEPLTVSEYLAVMWGQENMRDVEFLKWPHHQGELSDFSANGILALFEAHPGLVQSPDSIENFYGAHAKVQEN